MRYSFNHAGPYIDIPALDSFLHELRQVCKKYSLGYQMRHSADLGCSTLEIVHVDHCDWDMFLDCLADYEAGVPFLDEAKTRWRAALDAFNVAEAQRRAEQKAKAAQQAHERQTHQEAALKEHGLVLSDGKYKLVKVIDDP